ncbi:armadillo-type protein [Umbelopsis sp. PMI_123]|nr:armadillo-type protein [Umbelopsis sp. PMI_123]
MASADVIQPTAEKYEQMESLLCNTSGNVALSERFRILFTLKNIADDRSVEIIGKALKDDDSALLKHELAYCLGQTGNLTAIPTLNQVLQNTTEHEMVRHEAAEALGALGQLESLPILEPFLQDPSTAVAETCELAIAKIKYDNDPKNKEEKEKNKSVYSSVDPAPPSVKTKSIAELGEELINTKLPLFERYRAMFALRDIGNTEAVEALAAGFDDSSALFRHEIAYVFGQMQHPASVPSLSKVLKRPDEIHMVRHEAAEALGSIATPEVMDLLKDFQEDQEVVVRDSIVVALDMAEYENSGELQYADGLQKEHVMSH